MSGERPRSFLLLALALALSSIWVRPGPAELLLGGDSGIYARVASEVAARADGDWTRLTVDGVPFFEHPPLGLWAEAWAFRAFGATPATAVWLARVEATLALLFLWLAAWQVAARTGRLADDVAPASFAAFAVLGLTLQPAFLHQSQVAMLEMPLMVALALGLWATSGLLASPAPGARRFPGIAVAVFAVAVVAGFWVKGPPALVLVGLVAALVLLRAVPVGPGLLAVLLALAALALSVCSYDAWRTSRGLEAAFARYLARQVGPSLWEGRHNPDPNPWFYLSSLVTWQLPALLSLPVLAAAKLASPRHARRALDAAVLLGGLTFVGVVLGFSLARQKYPWYVHPACLGGGLLTGCALALVPRRFERWWPPVVALVLVGWLTLATLRNPWPLTSSQAVVHALQTAAPPPPGAVVRNCSGLDEWVVGHLAAFLWKARLSPCGDAARPGQWTFDGRALLPPPGG